MHSCFRATPKAGEGNPASSLAGVRSAPMRSSVRLRLHDPAPYRCQSRRHVRQEPSTRRQVARPPAPSHDSGLRPRRQRAPRRSGGESWGPHRPSDVWHSLLLSKKNPDKPILTRVRLGCASESSNHLFWTGCRIAILRE